MQFEWDETKSERNFRERGFGYGFVAQVFEGPTVEWRDTRKDWREIRIVAVGSIEGTIFTVVYTDRDDVRRIISARRARKKEIESWQLFASR